MNRSALAGTAHIPPAVTPVESDPSRLRQTSVRQYAVRFVLGGIATAAVGLISAGFGPSVAGLFLAFPAILIASLTLLARHDGDGAAGADALGAAIGAIGLLAFAAVIWKLAERLPGAVTLLLATVVWLVVGVAIWTAFDVYRRRARG